MSLVDTLNDKNAQQQTGLVQKDRKTIVDIFKGEEFKKSIMRSVPKHFNPERAIQLAMQLATDKNLKKCMPLTVIAGVMMGSTLGLEINTPLGQAYLISYGDKATFQLGYQGILNLCYRTNEFKMIYAHEVDKADKFSYQYGLNKDLRHMPHDEPTGIITHYYAVYWTKNGGFDFVVMSMEAVKKHRDKFSKAARKSDSAWNTNFDSMAKKTVLIKVLKYAPKSIELSRAVAQDETAKEYQDGEDILDADNILNFGENLENATDVEPEEIIEDITPGADASEGQKKNDPIVAEQLNEEAATETEKETEAEKPKLEPKQLQRIHILIGEMNKTYELIGKPKVSDADYRDHLKERYSVESSKDLSPDQATEFIAMLLKKSIQLGACDEAKEVRAAAYKKEKEAKDAPEAKKSQEEELPLIHEIFPDTPKKDFVGEARKAMLLKTYEKGEPLYTSELKEIGIDISTVPPEQIKDSPKDTKQADLFSDQGMPDFMK